MSFLRSNRDYQRYLAFKAKLEQASCFAGLSGTQGLFFLSRTTASGAQIQIEGRSLLNFSSYGYQAAAQHPSVIAAAEQALRAQGAGACASRVVAGQTVEHDALDLALAKTLGCEACVTFNGGFLALENTIGFLARKQDFIFHDAYIHRSSLEGIQTSGASSVSFKHNDGEHLREMLAQTPCEGVRFVLIEGVYSMDGDICPLDRIVELKKEFSFELIVDEAHSLGVLGAAGKGVGDLFNIPRDVLTLWMGTLSKALGACGGYAAGRADLIGYLRMRCPGFVYSAGMPPATAAGALAALQLMEREPERVAKLQTSAAYALNRAQELGLNTGHAAGTAILPIILGADESAFFASCALFKQGIYVHPLGWAAAPKGQARLRFFLTAHHSTEHIDAALASLSEPVRPLTGDVSADWH